ncbi:MAG: type II toxin-antitoxin system VapC family toxin [Bifidobacteriaceae bacterium]|jgi:predicted nucleic acid-binding protein|nr:type II toxin-antitoxin system VapC family toxin [Bifidobacteriaceae bacterium]
MGLTYLDSCVLIYLIEHPGRLSNDIERRFVTAGDSLAFSPLVRLECLVGPLRSHNASLEGVYKRTLERMVIVPLGLDVYDEAASLRAAHGLKTPDALHLAAARLGGCQTLWTNDQRFAKAAPGFAEVVV